MMTDTLKTLLAKMQAPELRDSFEQKEHFKSIASSDEQRAFRKGYDAAAAQRDVVIEMLKKAIEQRDNWHSTIDPTATTKMIKDCDNEELELIAEAALGKV